MNNRYDLSIIIPCYNEFYILRNSFYEIIKVMNQMKYTYEIIFIDDFSSDETGKLIKEIMRENPDIPMQMISHNQNEGRGKTVADGICNSRSKIVGFIDIDLSTPARYIPSFIREIEKGASIATALRVYKLTWHAVPRWIISKGYRFLVRLLLRLDLKDTETGCKFFDRDKILPILKEIRDNYWFWDTEVMVRSYLKGLKIIEIPTVFIRKGLYSRVRIFRDSLRHFKNLIRFRVELKRYLKSQENE